LDFKKNFRARFQRLMDRVSAEVDAAFTFTDDSLIASRDHETHEKDLRQFLGCLERHGLVMNTETPLGGQFWGLFRQLHVPRWSAATPSSGGSHPEVSATKDH
jgi:hypothetical protein